MATLSGALTIEKYHTDDNCESLGTSEKKEIFPFLSLSYLGNMSLQIEKKIQQFLVK